MEQGIVNKLTFGEALEHAMQGNLICREGWNGKGMFVFMCPPDWINVTTVMNIKSLPRSVRKYFEQKHQPNSASGSNPTICFTPYLCMKAADDSIVNGWLASQTDMLAADWMLFNPQNKS